MLSSVQHVTSMYYYTLLFQSCKTVIVLRMYVRTIRLRGTFHIRNDSLFSILPLFPLFFKVLLDYKVRVASMAMDFTDFSPFPSNVDVTTFTSIQDPSHYSHLIFYSVER